VLDHVDRERIRALLPANITDVDDALDEVCSCAIDLRQRWRNKRWRWSYKGHPVYVYEQVDKVVQLIDKFKSVGDVVGNIDPVHVGLPWAGIRAILEVCLSPRQTALCLYTDSSGLDRFI
jgi:hypothetical protein